MGSTVNQLWVPSWIFRVSAARVGVGLKAECSEETHLSILLQIYLTTEPFVFLAVSTSIPGNPTFGVRVT